MLIYREEDQMLRNDRRGTRTDSRPRGGAGGALLDLRGKTLQKHHGPGIAWKTIKTYKIIILIFSANTKYEY